MAENGFAKLPDAPVWRIGNISDPLAFAPHRLGTWSGRFDDPQKNYRTLYCSESETTALLSVLGHSRPSIASLAEAAGYGAAPSLEPISGEIPREWLRRRIMIPARIEIISGSLVNITDPKLRYALERDSYGSLREFGIQHFDLYSVVHNRELSRMIGSMLYEKGAAALAYPSPHGSGLCFALFEGRARLAPAGEGKSLEEVVNARPDLLNMLGLELSAESANGAPPPPPQQPHSEVYQLSNIDLLLYSQLQNNPELIKTLDWQVLEKLLADIIETFGYTVDLTRPTKDGGIDIIAFGRPEPWGKHCYLLQAKRWSNRVGIEPVRELMFLHSDLRATRACLATTSTFTKGAWKLSDKYRWQLELRDYDGLKEWIEKAIKLKRGSEPIEG